METIQNIDDHSFQIVSTGDPILVSDLLAQKQSLQQDLQDKSDAYDAGKPAALADIQGQIDAIDGQLKAAAAAGNADATAALTTVATPTS